MKLDYFPKIESVKIYKVLFILAFAFFVKDIVIVSKIEPIWKSYWDTNDYWAQSQYDLCSLEFYAPHAKNFYSPRPFTMSLMYKLVNSDMYRMVLFQKTIYCISVILLILSINKFITSNFIKLLNSILLFFFFTWSNIVGWSDNLISESISISFMLIWLANILWYYYSYSTPSIITLVFSSILFSFTRDSWPYIILCFFILNAIVHWVFNRKKTTVNLSLMIFFAGVFVFQNWTSNIGGRNNMSIFNSIVVRVSQNKEYLDWFEKEGMPGKNMVATGFKNIDAETNAGKEIIYKSYTDTLYTEMFDWIKHNGKTVYQKFLILHPAYFFLNDQTKEQVERIYAFNVKGYYHEPIDFVNYANMVFPIFNNYFFFLFLLTCMYIFYRSKQKIYLIPPLLGLLTIINALILYNADTLEVQRHLFVTLILREFLCILSVMLIINYLIVIRRSSQVSTSKGLPNTTVA